MKTMTFKKVTKIWWDIDYHRKVVCIGDGKRIKEKYWDAWVECLIQAPDWRLVSKFERDTSYKDGNIVKELVFERN